MSFSFSSVILYTFSGTGNTTKVSQMIKANFEAKGIETTHFEVGKQNPIPQPPAGALVGIGYPIHAFNAPAPLLKAMRSLEKRVGQKAFIFKVSGESLKINNAASKGLIRLLKKRGYATLRDYHFLMPYNIWFKYSDPLAKHMYRYSLAQSQLVVTELLSGNIKGVNKAPLRAHLINAILKIQQPAARLNGRLYKADPAKCTLCGICEKGCPVANIEIKEGKVNFSKQCAMCMYCSMYCPEDAISIGLLKFWKVNGPYPYTQLSKDETLPFPFITKETKGIKRLFINHYHQLNEQFAKYKIEV